MGTVQVYKKVWSFADIQKLTLDEAKQQLIKRLSMDQLRESIKNTGVWRLAAFADAFIFTILGFVIVTFVALTIPELINNEPTRLAVFWGFMFSQLFLGFLTFVALYNNSTTTLKLISTAIILLQLGALGVTSTYKSFCNSVNFIQSHDMVSHTSGDGGWTTEDCTNLTFLCSHVVLPNFIHSLIFSAILITFLYKQGGVGVVGDPPVKDGKQTFKFAHITIIIEEVV